MNSRIPPGAPVLVAGLARNVAATLRDDVVRLAAALAEFDVRWLVVESDSDDATVGVLRELEQSIRRFSFLSLGRLRDSLPERTDRIARCRNAYLDALRTAPEHADVEYLVVADLDGLNAALTPASVASCWSRDDWDVCTASQDGPYYDVWALRHPLWSPNDCWQHYHFLIERGATPDEALDAAIVARMLRLRRGTPWIAVDSAFGGFAIYRRAALHAGHYSGRDAGGVPLCEHVPLHAQLRAAGRRIFVNPDLVNARVAPFARVAGGVPVLRRAAARALRRLRAQS